MKKKEESIYRDIPMGLGMSLAQNVDAMQAYTSLDAEKQASIVSYIQSSQSSKEAKAKVKEVVENLKNGKI